MEGGFVDKKDEDQQRAASIRLMVSALNAEIRRAYRDGLNIEIDVDEPGEVMMSNGTRGFGGPQIEVQVSRPF